jgi:hypothetical protein
MRKAIVIVGAVVLAFSTDAAFAAGKKERQTATCDAPNHLCKCAKGSNPVSWKCCWLNQQCTCWASGVLASDQT